MIYLWGDPHFDHFNLWEGMRKDDFPSLEEMNQTIWDNLFTKLKRKDTLLFLGDFAMKDSPWIKLFLEKIQSLAINLVFIRGNHDQNHVLKWLRYFNIQWHELLTININKQKLILCHYAMRVWESSHRGSWQAHAHSHSNLCPIGLSWDCGVDANNYEPLSWDYFVGIMDMLIKNGMTNIDRAE